MTGNPAGFKLAMRPCQCKTYTDRLDGRLREVIEKAKSTSAPNVSTLSSLVC